MQTNETLLKTASLLLIGVIIGFFIGRINVEPAKSWIPEKYNDKTVFRTMGDPRAHIVMMEFGDFQCPLCKKAYDSNFAKLKKDYIDSGKVYYIYKHFPLNIHPLAPSAAIASDCAMEQNKFWEFHEKLFQTQNEWTQSTDTLGTFKQYASDLQLDTGKFNNCMDQRKTVDQVKADYLEASSKGVTGTPTFYLNGDQIVGAQDWPVFETKLNELLK